MTTQGDLFPSIAPIPRTCGHCVHRNALPTQETGFCSPRWGYQARTWAACTSWFSREQLALACAKRPAGA